MERNIAKEIIVFPLYQENGYKMPIMDTFLQLLLTHLLRVEKNSFFQMGGFCPKDNILQERDW